MGKFIDNLPAGLTPLSSADMYQEAYDKAGYKMSIYKVIEKLWGSEDIKAYYVATRNIREDVKVISKDEYESVTKAKELILANPFVQKYFFKTDPLHEILSQVAIFFDYMGEECKGFLDGILIDHRNKTITPYDLKTTGKSVHEFASSYIQYGYYRQCAFYEIAIKSPESPVKPLLDRGYTLLDFKFIVVETKLSSSSPAIIYTTSAADRAVGVNGGWRFGKYYKGINQLIEDYKYHRDNDYWDLPIDLLKNSGEVQLNIFDDDAEKHVIHSSDSE